jgi:hypothetical protein
MISCQKIDMKLDHGCEFQLKPEGGAVRGELADGGRDHLARLASLAGSRLLARESGEAER